MFTGLADAGADCDEASDTPWPKARLLRPQRDPLGQAEAFIRRVADPRSAPVAHIRQSRKQAGSPNAVNTPALGFSTGPEISSNGRFAPEPAILNRMEAMSAIVRTTDSSQTLRHVRGVPAADITMAF